MLLGVHACLNLTDDSELPQIYDEFRHTVANADHSKDLKYWANNHGDGMPTMWPQFEVRIHFLKLPIKATGGADQTDAYVFITLMSFLEFFSY